MKKDKLIFVEEASTPLFEVSFTNGAILTEI